MVTWTKQKLSDICEVRDGTHDSPKPAFSGYPLVTSKHIINNNIDLSSTYLINENDYNNVNKRSKVDKYDLLIGMIGTVGEVALVKEEPKFAIKNVGLIKTRNEILGRFIFYYLTSPVGKNGIKSFLSGSTQQFISLGKLRDLPITLPDKLIMEKITSVLMKYDNLIENNKKRIKILEEIALRLYTEWFVKTIDKDWQYKRLDSVAKVIRGTSYSSEQISDENGDYYIVNLKSFNRGGGFRTDGKKYYSGEISDEQSLRQNDIVVAVTDMTTDRAVISRPARIPHLKEDKVTFSADVVKIVPTEIPSTYLYYSLLDYRFTETTKNKANGANVLHLKPQAICEYQMLIPEESILDNFDKKCSPLLAIIDKLSESNEKLLAMRDLLISQLVTGKRELKN